MTTLTAPGVAALLVYGARLHPARNGRPGMVCMVQTDGSVVIHPANYPHAKAALTALRDAAAVCQDAGLDVVRTSQLSFLTRRPTLEVSS